MARGESTGLQVAVILLTMCVVGLGVSTWVFYQSSDTNFKLKESADSKAQEAEKRAKQASYSIKVYRHIIGNEVATDEELNSLKGMTGGDPEAEKTLDEFKKLKSIVDKATTPKTRNLSALPEYLTSTLATKNKQIGTTLDQQNSVTAEKAAIEKREQGRAESAEQAQQKATEDLAKERESFNQERENFKKNLADVEAKLQAKEKELTSQKEEADKQLGVLSKRISDLQQDNKVLLVKLDELKHQGPDYEVPDGEITWVNQRQRIAWINVGYGDGLMRQTTFSVYDHDENGVSGATSKAKLEVIRVVESHLAECKILEDDIKNPILPGDKIFTPAWSPGQRLHFALNGLLHIDDDNRPDNEEIKNIIRLNGGEVDAELTSDGSIKGGITAQTRYLIRGKAPSEKALGADEGKRALGNYSSLQGSAVANGVEVIDVTRFLAMMGWKAQERTTTLGNKRGGSRRDQQPATSKPAATTEAADSETTEEAPAPKAKSEAKPEEDTTNPFE